MQKYHKVLFYAGVVVALVAVVVSLAGADVNAHGQPQSTNPVAGVGLGLASLALLYASKISREWR